jgi:hypothetical protein
MNDLTAFLITLVVVIVLMAGLCVWLDNIFDAAEARECESYIENNMDKEFKIVGGDCSVLYHDLWVEVEKFEYSLP